MMPRRPDEPAWWEVGWRPKETGTELPKKAPCPDRSEDGHESARPESPPPAPKTEPKEPGSPGRVERPPSRPPGEREDSTADRREAVPLPEQPERVDLQDILDRLPLKTRRRLERFLKNRSGTWQLERPRRLFARLVHTEEISAGARIVKVEHRLRLHRQEEHTAIDDLAPHLPGADELDLATPRLWKRLAKLAQTLPEHDEVRMSWQEAGRDHTATVRRGELTITRRGDDDQEEAVAWPTSRVLDERVVEVPPGRPSERELPIPERTSGEAPPDSELVEPDTAPESVPTAEFQKLVAVMRESAGSAVPEAEMTWVAERIAEVWEESSEVVPPPDNDSGETPPEPRRQPSLPSASIGDGKPRAPEDGPPMASEPPFPDEPEPLSPDGPERPAATELPEPEVAEIAETLDSVLNLIAEHAHYLEELPPMAGGSPELDQPTGHRSARTTRPNRSAGPPPRPPRTVVVNNRPVHRSHISGDEIFLPVSRAGEAVAVWERGWTESRNVPGTRLTRSARKLIRLLARRYGIRLTPELEAYLLEIALHPHAARGQTVYSLGHNREALVRTLAVIWLNYGGRFGG